jgi:hypothetical protein
MADAMGANANKVVLCLVAALTLALGAGAASASALPEVGRCVKVAPGAGQYLVPSCTGGAKAGGTYEWLPGAVKNKIVSAGGASTLETVGAVKIACKALADESSYLTPTTLSTVIIRLFGCEDTNIKGPCENTANGGEIVIAAPGSQELGFIRNKIVKEKPSVSVGLDIVLRERILFRCQGPAGNAEFVLFGSVIAPLTPIDKMSNTFTLKYKASKGKQQPKKFELGPVDTLSLENLLTAKIEQAGLTVTDTLSNEEPLEVKAIP